jgi:hypothetical protein
LQPKPVKNRQLNNRANHQNQMIAGNDQKENGHIMTKTIFTGEQVEKFSL